MCFSATASFATSILTGVVGLVAVGRATRLRELPLAATPIIFAAQQAVEGALWLELARPTGGSAALLLTVVFLLFAEVLWPIYAPIAALLVEPSRTRRRLMLVCLAAGIAVALHLLSWIVARHQSAVIADGHLVYSTIPQHSDLVGFAYLAATGFALALSSQRTILLLGAIVLVGSTIAYLFYWQAFVSVWCFFAAAGSMTILAHFEQARRQPSALNLRGG